MSDMMLDQVANTQAKWLSVRQSLIASNVANASVPGFAAKDVRPMEDSGRLFASMVSTNPNHITSGLGNVEGVGVANNQGWETFHSGTSVSLPQEMLKAGEVSTAYQLNTSVMRSFHNMVITTFGT